MFATQVIRQPACGPNGEPFAVVRCGTHPGETIQEWFWNEPAAWNRRDDLLDCGARGVRVLGSPCHVAAVVPVAWTVEEILAREG